MIASPRQPGILRPNYATPIAARGAIRGVVAPCSWASVGHPRDLLPCFSLLAFLTRWIRSVCRVKFLPRPVYASSGLCSSRDILLISPGFIGGCVCRVSPPPIWKLTCPWCTRGRKRLAHFADSSGNSFTSSRKKVANSGDPVRGGCP